MTIRAACALFVLAALACEPTPEPARDAGAPSEDAGSDAGRPDAPHDPDPADECAPIADVSLVGTDEERRGFVLAEGCTADIALVLQQDALLEVTAANATLSLDDDLEDEAGWLGTRLASGGEHRLRVEATDGDAEVLIVSHGAPQEALVVERSLVWVLPALVDDPAAVGLGRVLAAIAADGHGGLLLAQWLTRFSTTQHSERAGPTLLLEELRDTYGAEPSAWDLDALPFVVTGVHNRVDLRDGVGCGELRVSVASVHDVWRPLHLIFLFAQRPIEGDVSPAGVVHCHATARRWARLSALDDEAFLAAARQLLEEGLRADRFLLVESEELTVSPWEWRQWTLVENPEDDPALPLVFDNPPLFQTVDVAAVNAPGPLRQSFLTFVEGSAATLDSRQQAVPAAFRPRSVRVNSGVPWVPLDLSGVSEAVRTAFPQLRQHIEVIGCAGCHMAGDFVQTREDRTFSAFYESELLARRGHLSALHAGALAERAPFGALQEDPPLTP